jgi:uncharacterized protein DUF4328
MEDGYTGRVATTAVVGQQVAEATQSLTRPGEYRDAGTRARWTIAGLVLAVTLAAAMVGIEYWGVAELDRGLDSRIETRFAPIISAESSVQGWFVIAFLATAVSWLIWQYRSARNAQGFGVNLSAGPKMGVASWFIPFANWVVPYRVMRDLYRGFGRYGGSKTSRLIAIWWAGWIVSTIGTRLVAAVNVDTIEQWRTVLLLATGLWAVVALTGVLAIVVIRRVQRWQEIAGEHPHSLATVKEGPTVRPDPVALATQQRAESVIGGQAANPAYRSKRLFCGRCGVVRREDADDFCRNCGSSLA